MTQYNVTVKKGTDIDAFYNEMETAGGSDTIPDRAVVCYNRRPISRNTGYDLTDEEVAELLKDDRVLAIEKQEWLDGIVNFPIWEQDSNEWDKSLTISASDKNWALKRCIDGSQTVGWGTDQTVTDFDNLTTSGFSPSSFNQSYAAQTTGFIVTGDTLASGSATFQETNDYRYYVADGGPSPDGRMLIWSESDENWMFAFAMGGNFTEGNIAGGDSVGAVISATGTASTVTHNGINRPAPSTSIVYDSASSGSQALTGVVTTTSTGQNVDVVVVDGFVDITHPEMQLFADNTGGTRMNQFNWFSLNPQVTGGAAAGYAYTAANTADSNHGMHVAGTICGNTQGWAREANMFNISPYGEQGILGTQLFDYIRQWHNTKPINPSTGRQNPTILNNSWGSVLNLAATTKANLQSITFQGTQLNNPTDQQLRDRGCVDFNSTQIFVAGYTAAVVADMEDCMDDGIIIVGAAGNEKTQIDVEGGVNYNNILTFNAGTANYMRGSSAGSATVPGVGGTHIAVCVGSIDQDSLEQKSTFSNCGPRVDCYAPGSGVMSAVNGNVVTGGTTTTVQDARDTSYLLAKYNGTSMASPQVCGLLACVLEQYPDMTQQDVNAYLRQHFAMNQITATTGGFEDDRDIQGSANRYCLYHQERVSEGVSGPLQAYGARMEPTNGVKYPRPTTMVDMNTETAINNNFLTLTLSSSSFTDGAAIPNDFKLGGGCGGSNDSPQLTWTVSGSHSEVASLRLECWDIDGGVGNSRDGYFRHWGVFDIPLSSASLAENATWSGSESVQETDFGPGANRANGWAGPCPPAGTPATGNHQYRIEIYPVNADGVQVTDNVTVAQLLFTSSG